MNPTREQVLQWAREAGGRVMEPYDYGASPDRMIMRFEAIERFAALAYAAGRDAGLERAAELVATQGKYFVDKPKAIHIVSYETRQLQADAIRALKGENNG